MSALSVGYMHDEVAAFEHVGTMIWSHKPICSHCGTAENVGRLTGVRSHRAVREGPGRQRALRPLAVPLVPQVDHRPQERDLQGKPPAVPRHSPDDVQQEGHPGPLASSWSGHHLQERPVSCPPHPRVHASWQTGLMSENGGAVEVDETPLVKTLTDSERGARGYAHEDAMMMLVERNIRQVGSSWLTTSRRICWCQSCARPSSRKS